MTNTLENKVKEYIKQAGYTWTYENIIEEYNKYKNGEYVSFTAKDVILNCINKHLHELPE